MSTDEQGYNGWTNWETWAVGMYLDGNYTGEGTYRDVLEVVGEAIHDYADEYEGNIEDCERECRWRVAETLREYVERDLLGDDGDAVQGLTLDFITSALGATDWHELAAHKVAEVSES